MHIKKFENFSSKKYVIVGNHPYSLNYRILCDYEGENINVISTKKFHETDLNDIAYFSNMKSAKKRLEDIWMRYISYEWKIVDFEEFKLSQSAQKYNL